MNNIKKVSRWTALDVQRACVKNNWYTCGDCEEYEDMLSTVSHNEYGEDVLYAVARDIYEHSEGETITNIMTCLYQDAVTTFFTED